MARVTLSANVNETVDPLENKVGRERCCFVGEKKLRAVSQASPPAARVEGENGDVASPDRPKGGPLARRPLGSERIRRSRAISLKFCQARFLVAIFSPRTIPSHMKVP